MPKPILVIGNKNYSSWSMRPWLTLKHMGVDFEETRISLFEEGYKQKILLHSRAGRVPVYKEDDFVVWESLAICEYLAEKEPSLWPSGPGARAVARAVSMEMHAGFVALRHALPMNCRAKHRRVEISGDVVHDIQRITEMWNACRSTYGEGGPWLFGHFSIADAIYAPVASRFVTYGIECDDISKQYIETVLSDEHLQQWFTDAAKEPEVIDEEEVGQA